MIKNDQDLQATLARIKYFQRQIATLRQVESNPVNYHLSVGGYLAELDRMNLEVRDYLWSHPTYKKASFALHLYSFGSFTFRKPGAKAPV